MKHDEQKEKRHRARCPAAFFDEESSKKTTRLAELGGAGPP